MALQLATLILVILAIFVVGLAGFVILTFYMRFSRMLRAIKGVTRELENARAGIRYAGTAGVSTLGFMKGFLTSVFERGGSGDDDDDDDDKGKSKGKGKKKDKGK